MKQEKLTPSKAAKWLSTREGIGMATLNPVVNDRLKRGTFTRLPVHPVFAGRIFLFFVLFLRFTHSVT